MSCYLLIDPSSMGSCFAVWSMEPVEGAVARVTPGKPVPKFKFTYKGGRQELIRDVGGPKLKPRLYQGYCQFIQIAVATEGTFTLTEPGQVGVYFNANGEISEAEPEVELPAGMFDAFAVVNREDDVFARVKTMTRAMFLDLGIVHGYALTC